VRMAAFWPTRSPTGEVVKVGFGSQAAVPDKSVIQNKPWSKEAGAARSFRGRSDQ
jgi:hypothetical protein